MKALIVILVGLGLAGCGSPTPLKARECFVKKAHGGALIVCPTTSTFVSDGSNGIDGTDGENGEDGSSSIVEVIDPCGDAPNQFDEVLLRLSTGELLAYFEDGGNRFLSSIAPGAYRTTDKQRCEFTVTEDLQVLF